MGCHRIIPPTSATNEDFTRFMQGDERGLTSIYQQLSSSMCRYGLRIVQDEFVVNTIVQEAFLKLWAFRERMISMDHITRFLKLSIRWECMAYYRHPMEVLYRKALRLNWMETWDLAAPMPEEDNPGAENRLHLVRSMIARLPSQRQRTIVGLYAKEGMTAGQIAKRLHGTTQSISQELHEGLANLRAMLTSNKKKVALATHTAQSVKPNLKGLNTEQSHIVTMRREMKYSFSQIADLLKLPQPYVQKQYVEACLMVKH
jgi:RNA polymerase sigma factor (sigma-70 family)